MANKNETKSADVTKAANPVPTFNVNDPLFQKFVQQAVEAKMAAMATERPSKMSIAGKSDKQIKAEMTCIRSFKRAGFGVVKPHEDVKTFNKWAAEGFRPKEGTKAVKVGAFRLFHRSQLRKLTSEEMAKLQADNQAAIARHEAAQAVKVVQLPTV